MDKMNQLKTDASMCQIGRLRTTTKDRVNDLVSMKNEL